MAKKQSTAKVDCRDCNGNGEVTVGEDMAKCESCNGTGKVTKAVAEKQGPQQAA